MQIVVPLVLALAALLFILMPLWGGATALQGRRKVDGLFSSEQLELDRELGKIDAQEYDELAPQVAATEAPRPVAHVEALVAAFRRQKRMDTALELEVMVARARRPKSS